MSSYAAAPWLCTCHLLTETALDQHVICPRCAFRCVADVGWPDDLDDDAEYIEASARDYTDGRMPRGALGPIGDAVGGGNE